MSDQTDIVDAKDTSLAAVTDDSHTAHFIEIVPLERASYDYFKPEFIDPVIEVKPEDLQDVKHLASDDYCKPVFIEPVVEVKPEDLEDVKQLASDDYCKPVFIEPVVEVKPEDLQDVKHRPSDDYCKAEFIDRVVEVKPEYSYEVYCIWLLLALHYTKLTSRSPCQFVGYPFTG